MAAVRDHSNQPRLRRIEANMFGSPLSGRHLLVLSLFANFSFLVLFLHVFISMPDLDLSFSVAKDYIWAARPAQAPAASVSIDFALETAAMDDAPFSMHVLAPPRCSMCDVAPDLCAEIGFDKMERSVAFAGSNRRLRRVLRRMRTGDPWVLGVIGGSVSTGQGIPFGHPTRNPPHHPKYRQPNMHRVIFDHLDRVFPAANPSVAESIRGADEDMTPDQLARGVMPVDFAAAEGELYGDPMLAAPGAISRAYGFSARDRGVNSMINGAQGATGSGYYAYCFGEHIPEDVDLIIVEQAINDERNTGAIDTYESMIRALLDLPNRPAIISIEAFALMFQTMAMGGDMGVNEYYDIPSISIRNAFIYDTFADISVIGEYFRVEQSLDKELTLKGIDTRHISQAMHNTTGRLVSAYIDTQICAMEAEDAAGLDRGYDHIDPLPRLRLNAPFDLTTQTPPLRPSCFSTTSTRHKLTPIANEGWSEWAWKEKKYLIATKPGSRVSFDVEVALGTVNVMYQRSAEFGLGNVNCWIEGEEGSTRRIKGYWTAQYNLLQTQSITDVSPGKHILTCELLAETADPGGGTEFRIASVTSI